MGDSRDFMKEFYHGLEDNTYVMSTLDYIRNGPNLNVSSGRACHKCLEKDKKINDLEETLNQVVEVNIQINKVVSQLISKRKKKSRSKTSTQTTTDVAAPLVELGLAETSTQTQADQTSVRRPAFLKGKAILLSRLAVDPTVTYQICLGCGSTYRSTNAAGHFTAFRKCRGTEQAFVAASDIWTLEDENRHLHSLAIDSGE
ncbi:hypothetical protein HDE_00943 [Halotydeus destructor]|nr:hypothetical protein HDE_00943 [Halotydeus destructor]